MENAPLTLWLDLETLDQSVATFVHVNPMDNSSAGRLELRRDEWRLLGKPSRIAAALIPDPQPETTPERGVN